jgi:hypothetical protein
MSSQFRKIDKDQSWWPAIIIIGAVIFLLTICNSCNEKPVKEVPSLWNGDYSNHEVVPLEPNFCIESINNNC